ncbi:hypothetical protein IM774_05870 [Erysipelotrichaceae bacterium RD49]|nr:hypothetical protein [Erysipelotrichaceae bacterium RD49]
MKFFPQAAIWSFCHFVPPKSSFWLPGFLIFLLIPDFSIQLALPATFFHFSALVPLSATVVLEHDFQIRPLLFFVQLALRLS